MSVQAQEAIRAAKNFRRWGRAMAFAFCRNRGVPMRLVTLARQLEAVA
jgi:hypothetical protein